MTHLQLEVDVHLHQTLLSISYYQDKTINLTPFFGLIVSTKLVTDIVCDAQKKLH